MTDLSGLLAKVRRMEAESLLLVLELDHLAGLEKVLQSYRGERVIFHGLSKLRARTGKKLGHGTQVGIKRRRHETEFKARWVPLLPRESAKKTFNVGDRSLPERHALFPRRIDAWRA